MPRYFALIAAAGAGTRIGGSVPKQYLPVGGHPLLYFPIAALCSHPSIEHVFVVVSPDDAFHSGFDWRAFADKLTFKPVGGKSRAQSVANGLDAMAGRSDGADWVLVHDAARPCLTRGLIDRLLGEVGDDAVGGLLALPVADTIKRADAAQRVLGTEPRDRLWQAQTPQMFRYELLRRALRAGGPDVVTDEASAVEALGLRPMLVTSDTSNLKVTYEKDTALAEAIIAMNRKNK